MSIIIRFIILMICAYAGSSVARSSFLNCRRRLTNWLRTSRVSIPKNKNPAIRGGVSREESRTGSHENGDQAGMRSSASWGSRST